MTYTSSLGRSDILPADYNYLEFEKEAQPYIQRLTLQGQIPNFYDQLMSDCSKVDVDRLVSSHPESHNTDVLVSDTAVKNHSS